MPLTLRHYLLFLIQHSLHCSNQREPSHSLRGSKYTPFLHSLHPHTSLFEGESWTYFGHHKYDTGYSQVVTSMVVHLFITLYVFVMSSIHTQESMFICVVPTQIPQQKFQSSFNDNTSRQHLDDSQPPSTSILLNFHLISITEAFGQSPAYNINFIELLFKFQSQRPLDNFQYATPIH
jgi:hypothetical protein